MHSHPRSSHADALPSLMHKRPFADPVGPLPKSSCRLLQDSRWKLIVWTDSRVCTLLQLVKHCCLIDLVQSVILQVHSFVHSAVSALRILSQQHSVYKSHFKRKTVPNPAEAHLLSFFKIILIWASKAAKIQDVKKINQGNEAINTWMWH